MEAAFPRGRAPGAASGGAATAAAAGTKRPHSSSDRLFGGSILPPRAGAEAPRKRGRDGAAPSAASHGGAARERGASRDAATRGKRKDEARAASTGRPVREVIGSALQPIDASHLTRAHELTGKRLKPGTKLLCSVKEVEAAQLVLALPHGLTGYVPLKNINPVIATQVRLPRKRRDEEEEEEEDDDAAEADAAEAARPALSSYFTVGQYVAALVVSVGAESVKGQEANPALALARSLQAPGARDGKAGRILLSLSPELLNPHTTVAHLRPGSTLFAYVKSVEDHGYVVEAGVPDMHAFLPFEHSDGTCGQRGTLLSKERPGALIHAVVKSINRAASTVTLSVHAAEAASSLSREPTHNIQTLTPGMLVHATVDRILPNGLACTFMGFFTGSVHMDHLSMPATALWAQDAAYAVGKQLSCRILYVNSLDKLVALSAAPFVVRLGGDTDSSAASGDAGALHGVGIGGPPMSVPDAAVLEHAIVLRVDSEHGVHIGWYAEGTPAPSVTASAKLKPEQVQERLRAAAAWGRTAYVHISRIADEKVDSVERMLRPGAVVRARVIGFDGMEGRAIATMKPSVVNASVLRVADVHPGDILEGTVIRLPLLEETDASKALQDVRGITASSAAVVVRLGENVTGAVSVAHLADVMPLRSLGATKARTAFFKAAGIAVGGRIRVRVFSIYGPQHRVALTLKPTLLSSALPMLPPSFDAVAAADSSRYRAGEPKPILHAVVSGVHDAGFMLTVFGGQTGLLPVESLVAAGLFPASKVRVEGDAGHAARRMARAEDLVRLYDVGAVIKVCIASVRTRVRRIMFAPAAAVGAAVPSSAAAHTSLEPGTVVNLRVVAVDTIAQQLDADVTHVHDKSVEGGILAVAAPLRVHIPFTQLQDEGILSESVAASIRAGDVLERALVLRSTRRGADVHVTLKPFLRAAHALAGAPHALVPALPETLRAGMTVVGYVASVSAFGVFVRFLGELTALVPRSKLPSTDASTDTPRTYIANETVVGVIDAVKLDVDDSDAGAKYRITLSLHGQAIARSGLTELLTLPLLAAPSDKKRKHATPSSSLASVPLAARLASRTVQTDAASALAVYVPGSTHAATVRAISGANVLLDMDAGADTVSALASLANIAGAPPHKNASVTVRVLDVDVVRKVVHVVIPDDRSLSKAATAGKRARAQDAAVTPSGDATTVVHELGGVVEVRVLHHAAGTAHAVVALKDDASALAMVDLVDVCNFNTPCVDVKAGAIVQAVLTQIPVLSTATASRKGKAASAPDVDLSPLASMYMCSAAPTLLSLQRGGAGATPSKPASSGARPVKRARAAELVPVSKLLPGMKVTAILRVNQRVRSRIAAAAGSTAAEKDEEDDEGEDEDDNAHAHESTGNSLPSLRFRLVGVSGPYVAVLSPAECVALCPYTGVVTEEGDADPLHRYKQLATATSRMEVVAKIVSVLTDARKTASTMQRFHVELTLRPADLAAPDMHLASERPCLAAVTADASDVATLTSAARITSASCIIAAAASTLASAGSAALLQPAVWTSSSVDSPMRAGAVTYGVVRALAESHMLVDLGANVTVAVPLLECGASDAVRDPITGHLHVNARVAAQLCKAHISDLHPLGSVVPIVLLPALPGHARRYASIRRAQPALQVAKAAVAAWTSSHVASVKKSKGGKKDVQVTAAMPMTPEAAFASATSAVAAWMQKADADATPTPGDILLVAITPDSHSGSTLRPTLPTMAQSHGLVDAMHMSDRTAWVQDAADIFSDGDVRVAVVLQASADDESPPHLSLRASHVDAALHITAETNGGSSRAAVLHRITTMTRDEVAACSVPGTAVSAFVAQSSAEALTLQLAPGLTATVDAEHMADAAVRKPTSLFHVGKLVHGVVVNSNGTDGVHVSLRRSDAKAGKKSKDAAGTSKPLSWEDLAVGQQFDARVQEVAEFGVFVSLDNTTAPWKKDPSRSGRINGLCHVSEISDDEPVAKLRGSLQARFSVGDRVRVVLMTVDAAAHKMSLSMRPSRISAAAAAGVEAEEADQEEMPEIDADDMSDGEDAPAAEASLTARVPHGLFAHLSKAVPAADSNEVAPTATLPAARAAAAAGKKLRVADDLLSDDEEEAAAATEEAEADGAPRRRTPSQRKQRKREQALADEAARKEELRIASGEAERNPTNASDFERIVAAKPNDAQGWIRYMTWLLSITETKRARDIGARALSTIHYREEAEKLSMWAALINLEMTHGDNRSLAKVFADAQAAADPREVYQVMLHAYQRVGASRAAECEALFTTATKKFGRDMPKLWLQWASFRFRRGEAEPARELLKLALTRLPKPEHVALITQFALLEYRFAASAGGASDVPIAPDGSSEYGLGRGAGLGSQERGRTLFESLLSTVPKRLDLWNVFLDQEVAAFSRRHARAGASDAGTRTTDLSAVRHLFDRVLTLKLSSKKMQFLLKKYLGFEQAHGDARGVAHVQELARTYVHSQLSVAPELDAAATTGGGSAGGEGAEVGEDAADDDGDAGADEDDEEAEE